jgi:methylphosphotriester-DNA--protein-cysteine methyltransferase
MKHNSLQFNKKIEICRSNNKDYDGKFYLAVTTTKIFCLPSCKAKFPLIRNIQFYKSPQLAIKNGFRPCKRCHPHKFPNNYPDWLDEIKNYLHVSNTKNINTSYLETLAKVNITTIRRCFRKNMGISLKSYQTKIRLEKSVKSLERGDSIKKVSDEAGYKSIKAFKETFKRNFGYYPRDQNEFVKYGLTIST